MESIIKIQDLSKVFHIPLTLKKVVALSDLTLSIEPGEVFGYLGPNGSGKTTTFKLLMGLIYPTSGRMWLWGNPIIGIDQKRKIGFLPENPSFYGYLKAKEYLHFTGRLFDFDRKQRQSKVASLLDLVGLKDRQNEMIRTFSKGMLQRLGLAQALINDPELLILDEPMSGLDPLGRKEVRDILLQLKERGRTIIFSTHILSDVEAVCDRVGILINGRLKDCGPIETMLSPKIKSFEICVKGLSDATLRHIKEQGMHYIQRGDETFINANEPDSHALLTYLLKQGGTLLSFTARKETIEEIYVNELKSR